MTGESIKVDVVCPACGEVLNRGFLIAGPPPRPKPGDTCVCSECSIISVFITPTALRCATPEEVDQIPPHEIKQLREAFLKLHGYQ